MGIRRNTNEFHAETACLDPTNGSQFDLNGSGLSRARNSHGQILSAGDCDIAENCGPAKREVIKATFAFGSLTRKGHERAVGEALVFPLFHRAQECPVRAGHSRRFRSVALPYSDDSKPPVVVNMYVEFGQVRLWNIDQQ